jgi:hypothetical protein
MPAKKAAAARLAGKAARDAMATYKKSRTKDARLALFKAVADWERTLRALGKRISRKTLH